MLFDRGREEGGKVERRLRRRNQRGKWLMREGRGKNYSWDDQHLGRRLWHNEGRRRRGFGIWFGGGGGRGPFKPDKAPLPRPLRGGQDKKRRETRPNYSLDLAEAADFFLRRKIKEARGEIDYISSSPFPPIVRRRRFGLE